MAEIKDLIENVKIDIDNEIKILLDAAYNKEKKIKQETEAEIRNEQKYFDELYLKETSNFEDKIKLELELEKKKEILKMKSDFLIKIYADLKNKIISLSKEKYNNLFKKYLNKVTSLNNFQKIKIKIGTKEKILNELFFKENMVSITINFDGIDNSFEYGFVFESDDFEIPITLDDVVEDIKSRTKKTIIEKYFDKN